VQVLGFGLALAGIWLLSRPEPLGGRPAGLGLALLAGLGFGTFFTLLDQIGENAVFWPLVAGRLAAVGLMVAIALTTRRPVVPANAPLKIMVLAGVLDASGNLFFLLAVQSGRLDIAAVLSSLYPAITTLLARLVTGEHMARLQLVGVAAALLAIVLITV
jgi:drug/metabolite transporter (DMT)-like permease